MADNVITVELDLETGEFKGDLAKLARDSQKRGKKAGDNFEKGFSNGLSSLRNRILGIGATLATAFAGRDLIRAAAQQEEAVNKLNTSLRQINITSSEASRAFQDYASELQKVTRFGDEAIIEQIAFAQSLGATAEQSLEIVTAATDLSAALNIDLNSAVRNITKTLSGLQGELGETVKEVRVLTKEQLEAGEAITVIANTFRGQALASTRTFSGAVAQLGGVFGDFKESLGAIITTNPIVIASIGRLRDILSNAISIIAENRMEIEKFVSEGLTGIANAIKTGLPFVKNFIDTFLQPALFAATAVAIIKVKNALTGLITTAKAGATSVNALVTALVAVNAIGQKLGESAAEASKAEFDNKPIQERIKLQEQQVAVLQKQLDLAKESAEGGGLLGRFFGEGNVERLQETVDVAKAKLAELNAEANNIGINESGEKESIIEKLFGTPEQNETIAESAKKTIESVSESALAENDKNVNTLNLVSVGIKNIGNGFIEVTKNTAKATEEFGERASAVGKGLRTTFANSIAQGFSQVGKAIAEGENALDAFAKSFLFLKNYFHLDRSCPNPEL